MHVCVFVLACMNALLYRFDMTCVFHTVQEDPEMRAMREKQERYVTQILAFDRVVEQWHLDVVLA